MLMIFTRGRRNGAAKMKPQEKFWLFKQLLCAEYLFKVCKVGYTSSLAILYKFSSILICSNTYYSISQINYNIKNKINYIKLQLSLLACANHLCRVSKMLHTRLSMTLLIFMCPSLVWQGRANGQVGGTLSSATFISSLQWASQAFQLLSVLSKNRWCREQSKVKQKKKKEKWKEEKDFKENVFFFSLLCRCRCSCQKVVFVTFATRFS